jgi:uncharacterized phage protein gp47/JayE
MDYYITNAKTIFGSDIYLDTDSADYQMMSITAYLAHDCMNAAQMAYNSFRADSVVDVPQDSLYKINGITRQAPSYSTCTVTLTGTAQTVITNGKVKDNAGYIWDLPTPTTIGAGGTVSVSATCETLGNISATIGTITIIDTPTAGWASVTNSVAASPGTAQETNSAFRTRQTESTELPAAALVAGILSAINTISGVTRSAIYENPTSIIDSNTLPAHSIALVVEGGTDAEIATNIYNKKTPGCYTYGTTSYTLADVSNNSVVINFFRPTAVPAYVAVTIKELSGYVSDMATDIKTAIAVYINNLGINEELTISGMIASAMAVNSNLYKPSFSITALTAGIVSGELSNVDIASAFNEMLEGSVENITVTAS